MTRPRKPSSISSWICIGSGWWHKCVMKRGRSLQKEEHCSDSSLINICQHTPKLMSYTRYQPWVTTVTCNLWPGINFTWRFPVKFYLQCIHIKQHSINIPTFSRLHAAVRKCSWQTSPQTNRNRAMESLCHCTWRFAVRSYVQCIHI